MKSLIIVCVCVSANCLFWGQKKMRRNCSPCSRWMLSLRKQGLRRSHLQPGMPSAYGHSMVPSSICVQSFNILQCLQCNPVACWSCFFGQPLFCFLCLLVIFCDHRPRVASPSRQLVPHFSWGLERTPGHVGHVRDALWMMRTTWRGRQWSLDSTARTASYAPTCKKRGWIPYMITYNYYTIVHQYQYICTDVNRSASAHRFR